MAGILTLSTPAATAGCTATEAAATSSSAAAAAVGQVRGPDIAGLRPNEGSPACRRGRKEFQSSKAATVTLLPQRRTPATRVGPRVLADPLHVQRC